MGTHDSENAANAAAAQAAGWPELDGSEKQIPWGITARANKVREMEATAMDDTQKNRWREALLRETRAGAWIDYREHPWQAAALANLNAEELDALRG
ncbi:hypothetical protein [Nocardia alni]|uniref:hypothetical protein n=1 Tax=Nocardia alni TaxID=2815723 RepID=UPI001C2260BA|nr:hypothetical protein [Nocardia alni]